MANKIPISTGFQRLTDEPLDSSSIANNLNEAKDYAKNSALSYDGQIIHINDARTEEDINNNVNIYEGDYYINNKNIFPVCQLSYKSIGMLIDTLYKLNEGSVTNGIFNDLRDVITDSYEKPEVPPSGGGGNTEDGEKPEYYTKPWDASLYNDHQIVLRLSQPSKYIRNGNTNSYESEQLDEIFADEDYVLETISVMHNGILEHYNVYTFEYLPTKVSFQGGSRFILELIHMCDTSEITDMKWMFSGCTSLKTLDLSSWDVSNVTNMYSMFEDCTALTTLNLDNWNTAKVRDMQTMFANCSSLRQLNVNHFNILRIEQIWGIFENCSKLTSLDLSGWDISNLTAISQIFRGCTSLSTIDISTWNTSKIMSMYGLFQECRALTSIDISHFTTASGRSIEGAYMFDGCATLTSIKMGPLTFVENVKYQGMFNNTYMLELNNIDMSLCSEETKNLLTEAFSLRYQY